MWVFRKLHQLTRSNFQSSLIQLKFGVQWPFPQRKPTKNQADWSCHLGFMAVFRFGFKFQAMASKWQAGAFSRFCNFGRKKYCCPPKSPRSGVTFHYLRSLVLKLQQFWNGSHAILLYLYFADPRQFTQYFLNVNFEVS